MPALGPIQALAGEVAAARFHSCHVNSQLLKPEPPICGNAILPVGSRYQEAALLQCVVDFNRKRAGEMGVTGTGEPQRVRLFGFAAILRSWPRSNGRQGLDSSSDFSAGQAIVSMPALDL